MLPWILLHLRCSPGRCRRCAPGHFQKQLGQMSCGQCAAGKFPTNSDPGDDSCASCGAGRYMRLHHLTASVDADPKNVGGAADRTVVGGKCVDCPAGKYHNSSASAFGCALCASGRFTSDVRSTSCKACPQGRYMPASGAASCRQCGVKGYTPSNGEGSSGARRCLLCTSPEHQRCGSNRSDDSAHGSKLTRQGCGLGAEGVCACKAGLATFRSVQGMHHCRQCPAGKYFQYLSDDLTTYCISCRKFEREHTSAHHALNSLPLPICWGSCRQIHQQCGARALLCMPAREVCVPSYRSAKARGGAATRAHKEPARCADASERGSGDAGGSKPSTAKELRAYRASHREGTNQAARQSINIDELPTMSRRQV